jgi:hypothetical protein
MKKMICLVRGSKEESYAAFKNRILALAGGLVKDHHPEKLKVVLTENKPPVLSIIPFKKRKIASISIVYDQNLFPNDIENAMGFSGSFEVTEALPVSYSKNWEDGLATPGVCLLTLFRQKKSIDYSTFIDRWHNSHTPLSLKLHPLWNYNRNVVDKPGHKNTESWDGIVEEHCKTKEDLLNPFQFFGRPLRIVPNMIAVYRDTKSFLDYGSIEPYLAMEYHIKS